MTVPESAIHAVLVSDDFPTLPDILNDNAGVVGAAAGLAVRRGIQATNKNLEQLKKEIGSMQREFARSRQQDKLEQQYREQVFQISAKLDELADHHPTPETVLRVETLLESFDTLNCDTSSFRNLQDKEFYNSTKTRLQKTLSGLRSNIPSDTLETLNQLKEWHCFSSVAHKLLQTERDIEGTHQKLREAEIKLPLLAKAQGGMLAFVYGGNNPKLAILFSIAVGLGLLAIVLFISAIVIGKPGPIVGALLAVAAGAFPFAICAQESSAHIRRSVTEIGQATKTLQTLKQQLQTHKETKQFLQREVLQCRTPPHDLRKYICDSEIAIAEREDKASEASAYAESLREYLQVPQHLLVAGR